MTDIKIIDNIIKIENEKESYTFDCTRISSYSADVRD